MGGDWNAIDLAMLLMLGVSLVVGGVRGLLYEVLSLAGWLVAYIAARWLGPAMAPLLPVGAPGSAVNLGAAMVACFIGALLIWALVTWLLQKLVHASPLKPVDRALGAVFGLTRGMVIGLAVVWLVGMTPLSKAALWQDAASVRLLGLGVEAIRPSVAGLVTSGTLPSNP